MAASIPSEPRTDDRVYVFRDLRLDLAQRVLLRDGVPVLRAVAGRTPKPLHVLMVLAEAEGQAVTKENLLETVWDNEPVSEEALPFIVNQLRKALKPHDGHLLVETVPRVGYRLGGSWEPPKKKTPDPAAGEPAHASGPSIENAPWRDLRARTLLALLALVVIAALVTIGSRWWPRPAPRVFYTQLTFDGLRKEGPLLTDGERIYFTQQTPEGDRLVSIPAGGGDATPVSTPLGNTARAVDIALNHRSLLLIKPGNVASAWAAWQWEIGASIAHRISDLPVTDAAWQPDRETVLLATADRLTLIRSGTQTASIRIPGIVNRIRWSPNGKTARIFTNDPATEQFSTWEMDSANTAGPLKPSAAAINGAPDGTWTSDGRYFVFATNPVGELGWHREGPETIGRGSKSSGILTSGGQTWSEPARGPSGNRILAFGKKLRGELVRFGSDGGFEPFLHGIPAMELDFSRDGRQLVYSRFPDHTLWVARPDGTDARPLTDAAIESHQPHFSPDGRTIAFMGQRQNDLWRIYSLRIGAGLPEPIVSEKEDQGVPTWSADGKFVVFGDLLNRKDKSAMALHRLDVEKKTVTTLPGTSGLWTPRWSPDGRYIAALTADSKVLMLYDVRLETWVELAQFEYFDNPTWSQDGRYIYGNEVGNNAIREGLYRVRLKDHFVEKIADLAGFPWALQAWVGVTPSGIPIGLHGVVMQDVYALDCDFP